MELVMLGDNGDTAATSRLSLPTPRTSEREGDGRSFLARQGESSITIDSESESESWYLLFLIRLRKKGGGEGIQYATLDKIEKLTLFLSGQ